MYLSTYLFGMAKESRQSLAMIRSLNAMLAVAAAYVLLAAPHAWGQNAGSAVPANTAAMAAACERSEWRELEPGLSVLTALGDNGAAITAVRIDQNRFGLALAVQQDTDGERVDKFGQRHDAVAAINGGFFGEKAPGEDLFPVGLLVADGNQLSSVWARAGGFLSLDDGRARLTPTQQGRPGGADILQTKPMLIEPGGKWAMNTNQPVRRWRSIACQLSDGGIVIAAITGFGLSLYEAGWLMRGTEAGGFFGCDAALALDGGGSTQLWLAGHGNLSIRGETPVHNALVVQRR